MNINWVLRAGALHIAFVDLHALGKTLDGSGIDTCSIESGTYTSAALRGIFGHKSAPLRILKNVIHELSTLENL